MSAALATATPASPARAQPARAHSAASSAGPFVEVMVVGAGNVILEPATGLSVPASTVRTAHGGCGVAAGTPLGALAALSRVGGPGFALRDGGHCGASPAGSGRLVVSSLDGESDHGRNGWQYKVDGRSGTAGAADPRGPFGNGRMLANGAQVLWFWCQSFGGGCQRTLEVSAPAAVAPGGSFRVEVRGANDRGAREPMSGARVSVGSSSAVTGASGTVTLRAPTHRGAAAVRASRPGSVPSFPAIVEVR